MYVVAFSPNNPLAKENKTYMVKHVIILTLPTTVAIRYVLCRLEILNSSISARTIIIYRDVYVKIKLL